MSILDQIKASVIAGNRDETISLISKAVEAGLAPSDIIQDALIAGMTVTGQKFRANEIFVPEMLIAAMAMKVGLEKLRPLLIGNKVKSLATIVLGTVKGDMHDIGKNLVGMMLEGAGCEVIDIGVDVSEEKFIEAIHAHKPGFVGISALLTTTMPAMKNTIAALEKAGIRDSVKVLVGGAPITKKFADDIGADGYAENAAEAVEVIKHLGVSAHNPPPLSPGSGPR